MKDRHLHRVEALRRAVLEGPCELDPATRRAAAAGTLAGDLGALAKKIHAEPAAIDDEDIATLQRRGHSDDALVELIAAAAFGAGELRLAAAKRVLGQK